MSIKEISAPMPDGSKFAVSATRMAGSIRWSLQVADAVALMGLKYRVLTSVDRDDLPDGAAAHYAACIRVIHARSPTSSVEAIMPDFVGQLDCGDRARCRPGDLRAELETVERLAYPVRDPRVGCAADRGAGTTPVPL